MINLLSYDNNAFENERKYELYYFLQAMLEDKLRETDWELTQETIEEQVARESYLQWLRDNEKRAKIQGPVRIDTIFFLPNSLAFKTICIHW